MYTILINICYYTTTFIIIIIIIIINNNNNNNNNDNRKGNGHCMWTVVLRHRIPRSPVTPAGPHLRESDVGKSDCDLSASKCQSNGYGARAP